MYPKFLIGIFYMTLATAASAQFESNTLPEPDTKLNGYKGNVKTMAQRRYEAVETDSGIVKGELSGYSDNYNEVFNPSGYILSEEILYGDTVYKKATYRRNTSDAILERFVYSGAQDLDSRTVITRNSKNVPTKIREFDGSGNLTSETLQEVNENGKVIRRTEISNGIQSSFSTMKYDAKGNLAIMETFNQDEQLIVRYVMVYDSLNRRVQTSVYDDLELLVNRAETIYTETNNILRETTYNFKGQPIARTEYAYDSSDNPIEVKEFEGSPLKLLKHEKMQWNEEGYLSRYEKLVPSTGGNVVWTYEYEYDETGNWILQNQFRNGVLFYIVERKITYFAP